MSLSINTFRQILRQIVADMAYVPGRQVNCFAVCTDMPSLDHESFGASYQDYLEGLFYSRSWVNQRADMQKFKGEHPALFMEAAQFTTEDLYDPKYIAEISLLLLDRVPCEGCPPNQSRTANTVEANVKWMLRNLLVELTRYRLYEVERDEETTYEWMTEERRINDNTIDDFAQIDDMQSYLQPDTYSFARWGSPIMNGMKDKIAYWVRIRVDLCEELDADFEHTPIVPGLATTICPC